MIYVLLLENKKIYVGYSSRPIQERILEHFREAGSEWTKTHKPLEVLSIEEGDEKDEDLKTLKLMKRYGWWNVRGGKWCQVEMRTCPLELLEYQGFQLPDEIKKEGRSFFQGRWGKRCWRDRTTTRRRRNFSEQLTLVNQERSRDLQINSENQIQALEGSSFLYCKRCFDETHTEEECTAKIDLLGNQLPPRCLVCQCTGHSTDHCISLAFSQQDIVDPPSSPCPSRPRHQRQLNHT